MDSTLLLNIHLFASLPEADRTELSGLLEVSEFPEQAIICAEGDPGDRMYLIQQGEVEVIKSVGTPEERILRQIPSGDYFGEMSLLEREGHRTATVRATTEVKLLELSQANFDRLLQRWPTLALDMLRELSLRMRETQADTIRDLRASNMQLAQAYRDLQAAQEQIIEKEKLERELSLARQIQMSMLPTGLPATRGFEFGARILPARAVGGDLYDFVPLSDESTIGVLIGDVSDKGVPAALFMALTRSLLRAEATLGLPPVEVLEQVNRHMLEMNKMNMFVSMLYGILVPETGEFIYARAGHEVPILVDTAGELLPINYGAGQLIGIFPFPLLDEQCIVIPPGGVLLLFTDGATDASNGQKEFFNHERLEAELQHHCTGTAQEICNQIFESILRFQGDAPQIDDITLVIVKSTGNLQRT